MDRGCSLGVGATGAAPGGPHQRLEGLGTARTKNVRIIDREPERSGRTDMRARSGSFISAAGLALVAALASRSCDGAPVGNLDHVSDAVIRGWALDAQFPAEPVPVQIRFWSNGALAGELAAPAVHQRPDLKGLAATASGIAPEVDCPYGFEFAGFAAPAGRQVMAECRILDRAANRWISQSFVPMPRAHESLPPASLCGVNVSLSGDSMRVECTIEEVAPASGGRAAARDQFYIEVFGMAGNWSTHEDLARRKSPGSTRTFHADVDLGANPDIEELYGVSGSLLIAVWVKHGKTEALVGATEFAVDTVLAAEVEL